MTDQAIMANGYITTDVITKSYVSGISRSTASWCASFYSCRPGTRACSVRT